MNKERKRAISVLVGFGMQHAKEEKEKMLEMKREHESLVCDVPADSEKEVYLDALTGEHIDALIGLFEQVEEIGEQMLADLEILPTEGEETK